MNASTIQRAFDLGKGILRLTPTWAPRMFCVPGRRIKLHPQDCCALGAHPGGIDERWFSSTTSADNGIINASKCDDLVILKHFGAGNPDSNNGEKNE